MAVGGGEVTEEEEGEEDDPEGGEEEGEGGGDVGNTGGDEPAEEVADVVEKEVADGHKVGRLYSTLKVKPTLKTKTFELVGGS